MCGRKDMKKCVYKLYNFFLKNGKHIWYYVTNFFTYLFVPNCFYRCQLPMKKGQLNAVINERVNFYNQLSVKTTLNGAIVNNNFKFPFKKKHKQSVYFFDMFNLIKYFPKTVRFDYVSGDVIEIPSQPAFVKSRPINDHNQNSILLPFNVIRHFKFYKDVTRFVDKQNKLVFRGGVYQSHRERFMKVYFNHPLCDCGQTNRLNKTDHLEWCKPFMSIEQQQQYKFIACIEGNDVATNLKWVMASNSIAVMPRPKYETWFMESTLIPNVHYIEIRDDFSNLIERLSYYIEHTDEALTIIKNAHQYVQQFRDKCQEKAIALQVVDKYITFTN